jgi:hypothetical protein
VLLLVATAFAANSFRPARSGSFAPQTNPQDFHVGFWDSRQFDPLTERPPLPEGLSMNEYAGDGTGYYLVQFGGPVYVWQIGQLQRAGGEFLGFHSRHLAFVKMNRAVAGEVAALPFVRWVGVYQPAYKLWSLTLAEAGFGRVSVVLFYPEDIAAAKAELEAMGLAVVRTGVSEAMKVIEVDCSRGQLTAVARLDWVFSMEEWHAPEPENVDCQWVAQTWTDDQRRVWDQGILPMTSVESGTRASSAQMRSWATPTGKLTSTTGPSMTRRSPFPTRGSFRPTASWWWLSTTRLRAASAGSATTARTWAERLPATTPSTAATTPTTATRSQRDWSSSRRFRTRPATTSRCR